MKRVLCCRTIISARRLWRKRGLAAALYNNLYDGSVITMTVEYKNPAPTVDIIIEIEDARSAGGQGIVLIKRRNPPYGWAIPGGFVDYGETLEAAAVREAREETGLEVSLVRQFHAYSDPARDPRKHTISTVFIATARGVPEAADDAADAAVFPINALPEPLAFDHADILRDYRERKY